MLDDFSGGHSALDANKSHMHIKTCKQQFFFQMVYEVIEKGNRKLGVLYGLLLIVFLQ